VNDRRGRWVAEFVLVVLGVLAAFAVENWRQSRSDASVEQHLLEGIAADLARDLEDLDIAILAARARIAATDDLLRLIGDSDAGVIVGPTPSNAPFGVGIGPDGGTGALATVRSIYPTGSIAPQQALLLAGHLLKFDVSDGSYSEARAAGYLELIRDVDLRSSIAAYYYDAARIRGTIDDRLGSAVPRLVANLETGGLSPAGGTSDERIAAMIRQLPSVVAGLKNVRYSAALQWGIYLRLQAATDTLRDRVASSLATHQ
jgi:hypothetical protein